VPTINRLLEVALHVKDLERSARFYRDVLGLAALPVTEAERERHVGLLRAMQLPGGQVLLLFLRGATGNTAVLPGGTIPPHGGQGHLHLAFAIPETEVEDWTARLQEHQVAIEGRMQWPRGGTSLYFRDPDGHLLELATPGIWSIF